MFDDQMTDQGATPEVEDGTPAPLNLEPQPVRFNAATVNRAELSMWNRHAKTIARPGVTKEQERGVVQREYDRVSRSLGADYSARTPPMGSRIRGGGTVARTVESDGGESTPFRATKSALLHDYRHDLMYAASRSLNMLDSAFLPGNDPSLSWAGPDVPMHQRFATRHVSFDECYSLPDDAPGAFQVRIGDGRNGDVFCARFPTDEELTRFDRVPNRPQWAKEVLTAPPGRVWAQGEGWTFPGRVS